MLDAPVEDGKVSPEICAEAPAPTVYVIVSPGVTSIATIAKEPQGPPTPLERYAVFTSVVVAPPGADATYRSVPGECNCPPPPNPPETANTIMRETPSGTTRVDDDIQTVYAFGESPRLSNASDTVLALVPPLAMLMGYETSGIPAMAAST